jgi:hypothetical protein
VVFAERKKVILDNQKLDIAKSKVVIFLIRIPFFREGGIVSVKRKLIYPDRRDVILI